MPANRSALHHTLLLAACLATAAAALANAPATAADRLVLEPKTPPRGHIVLVSGDEEYRSEEVMPMLGKILAVHHGYRCTVLFAFGPGDADYIDSNNQEG
ncbi:MAG: hypothetical protein RL215_1921, partial [Planctomycetota bacterium]